MALETTTELGEAYEEKQHQAAYIFDPSDEGQDGTRPAKRRKVSKKLSKQEPHKSQHTPVFQRLFDGAESEQCARIRQQSFERAWSLIDSRIQRILRQANHSTLHQVTSFLKEAPGNAPDGKIPSAFIVTGPNMASQDLLFEQLSDSLHEAAHARVVRLRSGDGSNLKSLLKKIIQTVLARDTNDEDELELAGPRDGRRLLNYDLEALYAYIKSHPQLRVVITFQDSEAFDSGLLSDFIPLLSSWLDRIPFALMFGIATSVELFERRLLKSTCQCLYGDQFDVEQTTSIVDKIFKTAVAHPKAPLRLGPNLVTALLERQRDQVASIPMFVDSLKYTYMCHFYANPLAVLLVTDFDEGLLQKEHIEAARFLPSFKVAVETAVKQGKYQHARLLLHDDSHLKTSLTANMNVSRQWTLQFLRILKILTSDMVTTMSFTELYLDALIRGIDIADRYAYFGENVKKMLPADCVSFLNRLLNLVKEGDPSLGLEPWADEMGDTITALSDILANVKQLQSDAAEQGHTLRSSYSGQSKVIRTTVVAQKVQLSRDTAALTNEDKSYTSLMDSLMELLQDALKIGGADDLPFNEVWVYDSKTPHRDVFIPRQRNVVERALSRPHDYLGCSCCKSRNQQMMPTLPTSAILYQLYLETGSLINAADLWSAYYAVMGEDKEGGLDERLALVLFYRALAELRAMSFVKQSRTKADHIAKLAWKGL
ncbi:origin recognition complex subunit 3 N-terminus-domain-containing protein [Xylariaceae sp. FL0016]|nr:origin recognition complex subunit 3 N-terminus-domain-containing protein [Xylariaceae sp. FL0016]